MLAGLGSLQAGASVSLRAHAALAGAGALVARGTLNATGSQQGSCVLAGAGALAANGTVTRRGGGAYLAGQGALVASGTVTSPLDFGFTIFVDIIPAALAASTQATYRVRLLADETEVPITTATLRAPTGAVGKGLSVTLAIPDPALVSSSASLIFQLGVWAEDEWSWVTLLDGGRLAGRDHDIGLAERRPTDTVQVSTIDLLGDRWQLAPPYPLTLYDPAQVDAETLAPDSQDALKDETGFTITPHYQALGNLTLRRALTAAYVEGCGFTAVETNLPDYRVPRVDFTMPGGYHAGVAPLVALFEPVYAADGETLWLLDPDEAVNSAAPPYALPLSAVVTVKDAQAPRQITDALIVSYQERVSDDEIIVGERTEQESVTAGRFGEPGYTETETTRHFRQFGRAAEPGVITREVLLDQTTTVHDHTLTMIHRERQQDTFDALNRKTGHTRTVEARVPDLASSGDLALLNVSEEKCAITYRPHPTQTGKYVQDNSTTYVEGLALIDNDNTYRDEPFRLPLTDAHRNGFVDVDADQAAEWRPLKTTTEALRVRGDGQLDVQVIVVDHLAHTTERSSTTPRVGEIALDTKRQRTRRVLVRLPGSTTSVRRVAEVSAGEMPRTVALALGRRKLARLNSPPRQVSIQLPAVDFAIRRGLLVTAYNRAGASGVFIVTGWTITGERLGTREQVVRMALDAIEVTG